MLDALYMVDWSKLIYTQWSVVVGLIFQAVQYEIESLAAGQGNSTPGILIAQVSELRSPYVIRSSLIVSWHLI